LPGEEFLMNRKIRAQQAAETLRILEAGSYKSANGKRVKIGAAIQDAVAETLLYAPLGIDELLGRCDELLERVCATTAFDVKNETTLSAARRLVIECGYDKTLCLNFASAKNAGGGFLGGSQAQEESLARSSALYATLMAEPEYYRENRRCRTAMYTDHLILSPDVPVFRDDEGLLLAEPYLVSFLTAPAVNAGAVKRNEPGNAELIGSTTANRIRNVLAVAVVNGYEHLVLGAWGCGVFQNDPGLIARLFAEALTGKGSFARAFRTVVFGVLDRTPRESIIAPFRDRFECET
jgi:uncharacterized protein (TIGR02452 family)